MALHIGRRMHPHETVHHRNGVRHDNRIENLELWTKHHRPGQRVADLVHWVVRDYRAEVEHALQADDIEPSREPAATVSITFQARGRRSDGYCTAKVDGRWAGEHRHVMEAMIGRRLIPGENVHHKNGVRDDNRPANLELWVKPQTPGRRVSDLVDWVLATYRPEILTALNARQDHVGSAVLSVA